MSKKLDVSKLTLGLKKEIKKEPSSFNSETQIDRVVNIIHDNKLSEIDDRTTEITRRTTLDIPKALHKKISQRALDKDLYLKDYFLDLAKRDLELE